MDKLFASRCARGDGGADVSLCEWLTHTPRAMVTQTLKLDAEAIGRFPEGKPVILPV